MNRGVYLIPLLALACSSNGAVPVGTTSTTGGAGANGNGGGDDGSGLTASGASAVGGAGAAGGSGASSGGVMNGGGGTGDTGGAGVGGAGVGGAGLGGAGVGGAGVGGAGVQSSLPGCALAFPYQDEPTLGTWLGGDSAYSTTLDATTALWSFQDTIVGKHGQKVREGAGFVANSFAWVSCNAGVSSIRYFWSQSANPSRAIFSDGVSGQRFWPQQPIIYQGYLFAAMTRVQGGANEIGTTLARVSNPFDSPDLWHTEYFDLAPLPGLGKGTVVIDKYAYLFGTAGQQLITRLPLDQLIQPDAVPSALLQYLANDGQWKNNLDTNDAKKLGFSANVGSSFRYLAQSKKWLALFTTTSSWPSANIAISSAPSLEGPWTKPINVYQVPEMTPSAPEYDSDTVCYAAIEHSESNPTPDTDLLFSYTCNSLVLAKQLANLGIYLPKIVKIKLPALE